MTINGEGTYNLAPYHPTEVKTGEGNLRIEPVADAPWTLEPQTVRVSTNFLTRPFANPTFILNPDGTAMVQMTQVCYTPEDKPNMVPPDGDALVATGKALHLFDGIDYRFRHFPDSIELTSSSASPRENLMVLDTSQSWMEDSRLS